MLGNGILWGKKSLSIRGTGTTQGWFLEPALSGARPVRDEAAHYKLLNILVVHVARVVAEAHEEAHLALIVALVLPNIRRPVIRVIPSALRRSPKLPG